MIEKLAGSIKRERHSTMADLASFVDSVDRQLALLFDETATLKLFEWPEGKYDTYREAIALQNDFNELKVCTRHSSRDVAVQMATGRRS